MQRDQRLVEAALESKGFVRTGGDHRYYTYHTISGLKTSVWTKTSHGGRELGDDLLAAMSKQCKLTKKGFLGLVDCPMSREEYENDLTANRHIRLSSPS